MKCKNRFSVLTFGMLLVFLSTQVSADAILNTSSGDIILEPESGRVGIGTRSPGEMLQVDGAIALGGGSKSSGWSSGDISMDSAGFLGIVGGTGGIKLYDNGGLSNVVTLENGGYVGIGTTNPTEHLQVDGALALGQGSKSSGWGRGDISMDTAGFLGVVGGTGGIKLYEDGISQSNLITLEDGGDVGIGFNNPTVKLDVNGVVRAVDYTDYSPFYAGDDALEKLMAIKCEEDTIGEDGWCDVDHNTLPVGVKIVTEEKRLKHRDTGEILTVEEVWDTSSKARQKNVDELMERLEEQEVNQSETRRQVNELLDSTLTAYDVVEGKGDYEVITVEVDGRSLSHMIEILTKAVQELKEENDALKQALCNIEETYTFC